MNNVMNSRKMELQQLRRASFDENKQTTVVKQGKDNLTTLRCSNKPMSTLQQNFEETFRKIKAASIKNEDRNFRLFNYVNEQINEIKKCDEQIQPRVKFSQESGDDVNQHKEILTDLESKLQTSESMREKYEQRCQDLLCITESPKRGLQSIFSKFDFAEEDAAPPPVHNLGLIEQKASQLLQHCSQVSSLLQGPRSTKASTHGRSPFSGSKNDRAAVEEEDGLDELQDMSQILVSVLGTGPKVPMGQELLHVNPPKFEDYRSDESDNEDDGGGGCGGVQNESFFIGPMKTISATFWMLCKFLASTFFAITILGRSDSPVAHGRCPHRRSTAHLTSSWVNIKVVVVGLLIVFVKTADSAATLPQSEYLALYDLYNSTNGADWRWSHIPISGIPWVFSANTNPCADHWQGVDCITVNAPPLHTYHVSSLVLEEMNLRGPLPNTLDNLTYLYYLNLNSNQLTGSIPSSIGNLTNLQYLDLYSNQLTGSIPSSIGNLTNLQYLELYQNQLTGSIPGSIGNFTNLQNLFLDNNQLTGSIPSSIDNLTNLQQFYLSCNQLTGSIHSSIGSLTNLQRLMLFNNQLTGSIPSSSGNLTNLQYLDLYSNQLTGSIPSSIGYLTNLQYLYLYHNQLNGSIPSSIGNLTNLQQLSLCINKLTGSIPSSIGNLTNLQQLILFNNQLTGSIPSSIANFTNLQQLLLFNNQLTGPIPSSVGSLTNLQYLALNTNQLACSIPSSIGNLTKLQRLDLHFNQLTGSIPSSMGNLTNLQKLFLDFNHLTGTIPRSIGTLFNLLFLSLPENHLTGSIPSSAAALSLLQYLDLSDNHLTGQLSILGHMRALIFISLQGNLLTGSLSEVFTCSHTSLQSAQLDDNQFTGTLPAVLFDLPSLVSFSMVGSCLHGTLPGNICNATQLEALILYGLTKGASCRARGVQLQSHQSFAGTMPSCLVQLPNLVTLLLASNDLSGSIARDIVLSSNLLQLDLSHNDLTGTIPSSLQNHSWSLLDLSHNKLSGTLCASMAGLATLSISGNITLGINNRTVSPAISLSSNRLSGPVPSSLRPLQSNLSVLAGNLFECKYDKSNLPQHDSDISNYQCASNDFNVAIYAWLSLCVGVTVLLLVVCRRNLSYIINASLIQLSDEHSARLTHLYSLLEEYHVLSKAAWCCAAFCLVALLPYYAIVSHYEGTHTYQYAYVLSAIYTSGVLPFVFDVLLLGLLIAVVYGSYFVKYTTVAITAPSGSEENFRDRWRYASVVVIYSLANVIVVLGANVAFVYVVLYQSAQVQTLAQVMLSLFKLGWSVAASPSLIRQLDMYFYPEKKGPAYNYFVLQLLIALFNNIAIPCLVVAAIDPNCFSNILLPPDTQTVNYLLPTCRNLILAVESCLKTTPELATLQFTPPFTYSYQCSASFITSYAPTFIYMSISTVFLNPLLQYALLRLHERLPAGNKADNVSPNLRRVHVIGAVGTLVTLLTQLGILLTFGAIFPPVALTMAVSITAVVVMTRYKVHWFVRVVAEKQIFGYLDIINAECERVGTREQMQVAVKILICYCCAFYTLFLFDTLGDAVGFEASVWVLVVFPLQPFVVFGVIRLWRFYQVNLYRQAMKERSQEFAVGIELSATRSDRGAGEGSINIASEGDGEGDGDIVQTVNILHSYEV